MNNELHQLHATGALRDIDLALANMISRMYPGIDPKVALAAALVSNTNGNKHICLDLVTCAGTMFPPDTGAGNDEQESETTEPVQLPCLDTWRAALRSKDAAQVVGMPGERKLLVLDDADRLYLHRFWQYESNVSHTLIAMACLKADQGDRPDLGARINNLFDADVEHGGERQRLAAFCALRNRLTVITGGPGTGKTYTIAHVLTLLIDAHLANHPEAPFRIRMAAPTGKAATRMVESIRAARKDATSTPAWTAIPDAAETLHRMLGLFPGAAGPRYHRKNPLPAEVILVDEASMIDLSMMAMLLDALPDHARLILLGDMDQLASVDPGAVLGDICRSVVPDGFSDALKTDYAKLNAGALNDTGLLWDATSPLSDCVIRLRYSRRFPATGPVAQVSDAINAGNADRAVDLIRSAGDVLRWHPTVSQSLAEGRRLPQELIPIILAGYRDFLNADTPEAALDALKAFRILCALRNGRTGVSGMNRLVEQVLSLKGLVNVPDNLKPGKLLRPRTGNYDRQPILIMRNDYNVRLSNGDVGVIFSKEDPDGGEKKYFAHFDGLNEKGERIVRTIPAAMLPEHQTAFAMTIHKSQGSEFDHVLTILPAQDSPILTRELVYTAITRTRSKVDLCCPEKVLRTAIQRQTTRNSGLRDALIKQTNP